MAFIAAILGFGSRPVYPSFHYSGTTIARTAAVANLAPHKEQRRRPRLGLKVIHRHRIGGTVVRRVSELVFINGRPVALLEWIDLGGVRTPLFTCELDMAKLQTGHQRGIYQYDDVTVDPRFEDKSASS